MLFDPYSFVKNFSWPPKEKSYEDKLNTLKGTLKESFEHAFGEEALLNYYLGNTKVQKHDENDFALRKGKKPWLESKAFNPHFPHEELADLLQVKFIELHATLRNYFMAVAVHKQTGHALYADLAEDFFIDFEVAAHQNRLPDCRRISQRKFKEVRTEIARTVDVMIEHTLPPQYRLPETHERHIF